MLKGLIPRALDVFDIAGREIEFYCGAEMYDLFCRIGALSRRRESLMTHGWTMMAARVNDLEQPHRLEKVKLVTFGEEPVFNRRRFSPAKIVYSSAASPAIGSHVFQIPSRCLLLITNCVNELIEA